MPEADARLAEKGVWGYDPNDGKTDRQNADQQLLGSENGKGQGGEGRGTRDKKEHAKESVVN